MSSLMILVGCVLIIVGAVEALDKGEKTWKDIILQIVIGLAAIAIGALIKTTLTGV